MFCRNHTKIDCMSSWPYQPWTQQHKQSISFQQTENFPGRKTSSHPSETKKTETKHWTPESLIHNHLYNERQWHTQKISSSCMYDTNEWAVVLFKSDNSTHTHLFYYCWFGWSWKCTFQKTIHEMSWWTMNDSSKRTHSDPSRKIEYRLHIVQSQDVVYQTKWKEENT